jgi:uncharacterized membrane protein YidH (DUF202 family)
MCALFLFGIPAAIIANAKGFRPWRWLLSLGIIGFIVVICFASAEKKGLDPAESARRAEKANSIGAFLCGINIFFVIIFILAALFR